MKSNISKHLLCALLLTAFGTVTTPAARLVYEGFDYPPLSTLNGQSGGSGFAAAAWNADTGVLVQPPPGLSTKLGLASTGLCVGGSFYAFRQVASPLNQTEFWVSFMIKANPGNDMVYLGLDNVYFGRILNSCFIRLGNTMLGEAAYGWVAGSTDLLVARFKQVGPMITQVDLWVNPPGMPQLTVTVPTPAAGYTLVTMQVQPGFLADEIRIGTTPGDVAGATLGWTISRGNLTLTWPTGTLLQALTPSGPWQTNPASSPYTVPMTNSQQYYRVVVQ